MMKSKTILAAAFAAVSVSAANADVSQESSAYAYDTPKDSIFGANISGGYMFDLEEAYALAAFGIDVGADSFVGIQLTHMSDDGSISGFGEKLELDLDYLGVGVVWRGYHEVANNGGFYYSASAGLANYDIDGRLQSTGEKGSDSDSSFYIDGAVGFQQFLSENVAFNIGVRLLHLDDVSFEDKGVRLESDFSSIYVGLEAGLVFSF